MSENKITIEAVNYITSEWMKFQRGERERFIASDIADDLGMEVNDVLKTFYSLKKDGTISEYVLFYELGISVEEAFNNFRNGMPTEEDYRDSFLYLVANNSFEGKSFLDIMASASHKLIKSARDIVLHEYDEIIDYVDARVGYLDSRKKYVLVKNIIFRMVLELINSGVPNVNIHDLIGTSFELLEVEKDRPIEKEVNAFESWVNMYRNEIPTLKMYEDALTCIRVSLSHLFITDKMDLPEYLLPIAEVCALRYYRYIYGYVSTHQGELTLAQMGEVFGSIVSYISDRFLSESFINSRFTDAGIEQLIEHAYTEEYIKIKGEIPKFK